jgi:hypothetical protein
VNRFALGYGLALSGCLTGNLLRLVVRDQLPVSIQSVVALVISAAVIAGAGWFGLRAIFTGVSKPDLRASFRAADPRGWRSVVAGFLSGLAGIAAAVASFELNEPSGHERDPRTILAGALVWVLILGSPIAGAVLFLWLFRPRSPQPPPRAP